MFTERDSKTKAMGFGNTKEEALQELLFNNIRSDINNDKTGEFKRRREELYSWLPLPNMLVIKSVAGISYNSSEETIINTANNLSYKIKPEPLCHYYHIFNILDGKISFEDFTLTIGKEINAFLLNISADIGTLDDFPYIKPADMSDAISIHYLETGGFICETKNNTLLLCNGTQLISLDLIAGVKREYLISYGMAKLGMLYRNERCKRI